MKSIWILLGAVALASAGAPAGKIVSKASFVKFFSATPLENIEAQTNSAVAIFEPQANRLRVRIPISTFVFPNHLMQEHFNENYMETEKYPVSSFEGTTVRPINWDKVEAGLPDSLSIDGELEIHGVKKRYNVAGVVRKLPSGEYTGEAKFMVRIADHGIKVPAIVFKNIAEQVEVTLRLSGKPEGTK